MKNISEGFPHWFAFFSIFFKKSIWWIRKIIFFSIFGWNLLCFVLVFLLWRFGGFIILTAVEIESRNINTFCRFIVVKLSVNWDLFFVNFDHFFSSGIFWDILGWVLFFENFLKIDISEEAMIFYLFDEFHSFLWIFLEKSHN